METETIKAPAQWEIDAAARKAAILATLAELGLTIESEFVPLSQSRNAGQMETRQDGKPSKTPRLTLNWRVTVKRNGRAVLTTDFNAGCAHAPAYKLKAPSAALGVNDKQAMIAWECENGFRARFAPWGISKTGNGSNPDGTRRVFPILPDACDVFYSLATDSSVLDSGTFEEWAEEFGYDSDSRKGEAVYRACLELALKMRNGLGDVGLSTLRESFEGY